MSFLSDLFHGNFSNLGEDIAPSNIFKDFGSSAETAFKNPIFDVGLGLAALTGGLALGPEILAGLGGGAAAEGGLAAADAAAGGFDLSTIGPGVAAGGGAAADAGGVALAGLSPSTYFGAAPLADTAAAGGDLSGLMMSATPADMASATAGLPADIAGVGTDTNPALFGTVGGAGGESGPTVASTLTGDFGGGNFAAAGGGAAGGGATAPAASVFGPAPSAFDVGTSPIAFGGANAGAAAAGAAPAATPGIMSTLGTIGSGLKSAAPWLGAAGLGYNLYQGYQANQAQKALAQQEQAYQNQIAGAGQAALTAAQPLLAAGQALTTGGPIPAGMQAILDNYRNAQRARIIQGYAARGQSADPKMNTSLAQDLNAVDNQMLAMQESIGTQMISTANSMLQSGASATQIAAELPMMMQRLDIQLQQMTGNAIANFASAMSGGTMKVGGLGSGQNINLNLTGGGSTTQSLLTG